MRLPGPLHSATAFCLLALLGALGTGLPSHHHEGHASHVERELTVNAADQHSHGTRLVEQDERTPSGTPYVAAAAVATVELTAPTGPAVEADDSGLLRPTGRAPPPGAPRAPPSA